VSTKNPPLSVAVPHKTDQFGASPPLSKSSTRSGVPSSRAGPPADRVA